MGMQNKVLTIESNATAGSTTVSLVGEVKEAGATAAATPAPAADATPMTVKDNGKKVKEKADGAKIKAKTK